MDDVAHYNRERWKALAAANALFTRPLLDLTPELARLTIDPGGDLGDLHGKQVLCLASGGGQQSVCFALLGATVSVVDLSAEQLDRDRQAAEHYGLSLSLYQSDMRDLSVLPANTFDIVWQPYSLNFVPDVAVVFAEVARVIKVRGRYNVTCANPFAAGITEHDWNGEGYTVKRPYQQGQRLDYQDQNWAYDRAQHPDIAPPVEYRHTLSTLVNSLSLNGFVITRLQEIFALNASQEAQPGTWEHFTTILPPWLNIRTVFDPDVRG